MLLKKVAFLHPGLRHPFVSNVTLEASLWENEFDEAAPTVIHLENRTVSLLDSQCFDDGSAVLQLPSSASEECRPGENLIGEFLPTVGVHGPIFIHVPRDRNHWRTQNMPDFEPGIVR